MFASTLLPLLFSVPARLALPSRGARAAGWLGLPLLAALLLVPPGARAQNAGSLTVLHGFLGTDGAFPNAPLVQGGDGNFYGTTEAGGATGNGTVFRVTPAGVYTLLYSFTGGSDGTGPNGGLVQGSDGNFYGTTSGIPYLNSYGGMQSTSNGTVFKITSAGVLTTLYSFTGGDGLGPNGGLMQGSDGNFYGTAEDGGAGYAGSVFQVTPAGTLTTLYSFGTSDDGSDGGDPRAGLVQGGDGNFYGTTEEGGANGYGTIFQVTLAGTLTTLYSFTGGDDGESPNGNLVRGSDGNFYGETDQTIFQVTPTGGLTTLYTFGAGGVTTPQGGLVQGSDGNFYGEIQDGGVTNDGVIFQLTPAGAFTIVFAFSGSSNGADPGGPTDGPGRAGPLVLGGDGSFYGVAGYGGAGDDGTVFRLALSSGAPGSGTVSLAAASTTTVENAGSVILPVVRVAGSTGPVSVDYSTADVSAVAGTDYQPVSGTLIWADGDSSPKSITVPLIDRGLNTGGSVLFAVNLGNPGGGAALASPTQEAVTILDTESAVGDLLSTNLLSPPAGITFTQNQPVRLLADVEALANTLVGAEFFATDSAGNSTDLGGFTGESGQTTWQPAAAGDFTLVVVATDVQGNTQRAEISVNVVAAASVPALPQATLEGGLDGTTLALGDTVDVVAQAVDSQGNPLENAQFYLDGVPIATTPVGSDDAIRRAGVKAATVSAGNGTSLFSKASVPVGKPQQSLTAVGTTSSGVSAVSSAATFYGKLNAGTPPAVALSTLNNGDSVSAGSAGQSVTVAASAGSLPIDHVELFVDDQNVGTATAAPYTFVLPALKQGTHSVSAKATDTSLLSKVSEPVIVAAIVPAHPSFFSGQAALSNGVYYLAFPNGNYFGYYSYLTDPRYLYHFDLGYEYLFDAQDGKEGVYFYDFKSSDFLYTSPSFPFPYLFDFGLNSVVYYYPDPNNPGHYNTDGYRFFYVFSTGQVISK